jgi:hypothetical protein
MCLFIADSAGGQGCTIHQVGCLPDGTRHPDNAQMLAQAKLHERSQQYHSHTINFNDNKIKNNNITNN